MEFVQRSPAPEQPDDFQQRPPNEDGPPVFVERARGAGEPAAPPDRTAPDESAEVGKVLARYGVESRSDVGAPRRESDIGKQSRSSRPVDPWGR